LCGQDGVRIPSGSGSTCGEYGDMPQFRSVPDKYVWDGMREGRVQKYICDCMTSEHSCYTNEHQWPRRCEINSGVSKAGPSRAGALPNNLNAHPTPLAKNLRKNGLKYIFKHQSLSYDIANL
jgi:hypothetical protein